MSVGEIIVLVVVCIAFVAAVAGVVIGKVRHKGGCCDCGKSSACSGNCPHCASVPVQKNETHKE